MDTLSPEPSPSGLRPAAVFGANSMTLLRWASMLDAVITLLVWTTLAQGATPADAVFQVFKRADAGLINFRLLQRTGVTGELDLVVAIGSPKARLMEPTSWVEWGEERKIGLFLQEKLRPGRVYILDLKSGFPDCTANLERVTATDTVISCHGEKSYRLPHRKWVYDVRAKKLIGQFSYEPFAMYRGFAGTAAVVFVGSDNYRKVAIEYNLEPEPAFRVLRDSDAKPWLNRVKTSSAESAGFDRKSMIFVEPEIAPPPKFIPALPRTTYDRFAKARPSRVKDGYVRAGITIADFIGPWQREDKRIWFGKSFYDGEGQTGVGGFGYFDTKDRQFHMFAPAEIADFSVSAIDVGPDAVLMALVHHGEWGGSGAGLLRYDRQSGTLRRFGVPRPFEIADIVFQFIRTGGSILAVTDFGITVIEGESMKRYFVDRTTDGRLRVAASTR